MKKDPALTPHLENPEDQAALAKVMKSDLSKSQKMIQLFELGWETKEISEFMTAAEGKVVRYNFVYNVVSNYCAVNGIKPAATAEKSGKKEQIIAMFLAGKTTKEISIDLRTNGNYVFNTIKAFKLANPGMYPPKGAVVTSAVVNAMPAASNVTILTDDQVQVSNQ